MEPGARGPWPRARLPGHGRWTRMTRGGGGVDAQPPTLGSTWLYMVAWVDVQVYLVGLHMSSGR